MTTRSAAGGWIRRFHPAAPGAPRLVCLPHAGGAAGFFTELSRALSPAVDVLAVQYPGRQDRLGEPALVSLPQLADRTCEALLPSAEQPLALFGHSLGAALAFEVAMRLESRGRPVLRVFASGRRAPSRHRDEDVHRRSDEDLLAELRLLGGSDPRLLDEPSLRALVLPSIRSDFTAVETYVCPPGRRLRAPVTALTGADDPRTTLDEAWAWSEHTTGAFDLRILPGGHFYLVDRAAEVHEVLAARLAPAGADLGERKPVVRR